MKTQRLKAVALISMSGIFQSIGIACIKELSTFLPEKVSSVEMCFVRFFVLFLYSNVMLKIYGVNPVEQIMEVSAYVRKMVLTKMVLAPLVQTLFVVVFTFVPMSLGTIIFNTSPFFVAVLGYFVNREKMTVLDFWGIIFSFTGVFMLVYFQDESGDANEYQNIIIGVALCFVYVMGVSCDVVITRNINKIHFAVVVFWISALLTIFYASWLVYDYSIGGQIRLINYAFDPYWKLLLILGFAASTRILCETLAFQIEKSILMTSIQ